MNRIEKHQQCIDILMGIKSFQRRIITVEESINGFPGTFLELRIKYAHRIDIYIRCINRLNQRYYKLLNEIR